MPEKDRTFPVVLDSFSPWQHALTILLDPPKRKRDFTLPDEEAAAKRPRKPARREVARYSAPIAMNPPPPRILPPRMR